jgi:serine/threonine protein kinase
MVVFVVIFAISIVVLAAVIGAYLYQRRSRTKRTNFNGNGAGVLRNGTFGSKRPGGSDDETANLLSRLKKTTKNYAVAYDELMFGRLLGKGSQGDVYRADWRGTLVAVKTVDMATMPAQAIEEFCTEAEIMRQLRHPCLNALMGVCIENPNLCIITELVARGSLFDLFQDKHTPITWRKCLGVALDVARGVLYLHEHDPPILHRDLKSLNILVDEQWRGKVADFGMTRFKGDGAGTVGMTQCGSPLWMSVRIAV